MDIVKTIICNMIQKHCNYTFDYVKNTEKNKKSFNQIVNSFINNNEIQIKNDLSKLNIEKIASYSFLLFICINVILCYFCIPYYKHFSELTFNEIIFIMTFYIFFIYYYYYYNIVKNKIYLINLRNDFIHNKKLK